MGTDNRVTLVYANGRELHFTYDKLRRVQTIYDPVTTSNVATYDYIGPARVLQRSYKNDIQLTYLSGRLGKDIGYDGLKRPVLQRHLLGDVSLVAGFAYDYDRANNRRFEIKQHEGDRREDYAYDSVYRLAKFARQGETEDIWQLDGVGNWASRQGIPNQLNTLNEYTTFAGTPQLYDANGNVIDDGTNLYQYDGFNCLRKVVRKADNAVIASYSYDAYHRRTGRIVTKTGSFDDRVSYLYEGWQEIEEQRDGSRQQYVYGMWIDEPLRLDRDMDNDGKIDTMFFYHEDAKRSITALTDEKGAVIEQYTYDAYGKPTVTDAQGVVHKQGSVGNPYLFAGRRYDPETNLYYFRARYLKPHTGRFISRDPIGIWRDLMNLGNGYTYVHNNPIVGLDPTGEAIMVCEIGLCMCGSHAHLETTAEPFGSTGFTCVCDVQYADDVDGGCSPNVVHWGGRGGGGGGSCPYSWPLPNGDSVCNIYDPWESYEGVSKRCFCKCTGNSPWEILVRGCLICLRGSAFSPGADDRVAHALCYDATDRAYPGQRPTGSLLYCWSKCVSRGGVWRPSGNAQETKQVGLPL